MISDAFKIIMGVEQGNQSAAFLYCFHIDEIIERLIDAKLYFPLIHPSDTRFSPEDAA